MALGLFAVIRWGLKEEMLGGTGYGYVFGKGKAGRLLGVIN